MSKKTVTKVGNEKTDKPASSSSTSTFVASPEAKKKASTFRIIAAALWVLALGCMAGAVYFLLQSPPNLVWMCVFLVLDLIFVVAGSLFFWKKANRLDPASEKDKIRFFLQNQLGVIAAVIAFLPLIVLIFMNKDLSGKQKGIFGGIAVAALIVAGLLSADFDPASIEQYTAQINQVEELTGRNYIYWAPSGRVFHLHDECHHLGRSAEIFEGTVQQAHEIRNIDELCSACAGWAERNRDILLPDIQNDIPYDNPEDNHEDV